MQVLQLTWEFSPHIVGGMGRHVAELTPALANAGVQVCVLTPQLRGGLPEERLSERLFVRRVPLAPANGEDFPAYVMQANWRLEQAAHALAEQLGPFDLIHAHDWLCAEAAYRLKHQWRIPLVATIHATERGRGRGNLPSRAAQQINDQEWMLSYEAWRVIVCSQFMARQVGEYFHAPADKIDVIPNGVNLAPVAFDSPEQRKDFRRRFAADDEHLVFHVGRIVYEKGLQVLLDAWPQIATAKARLLIAGTGDYLDSLKAQAAALGIGGQVHFAGFVSDADRDRMYQVADLAVFPSLYEPFGIVALEAFAAGCPLVVSNAGGLAEVVAHEHTGLICQSGHVDGLAAAVLECLGRPAAAQARVEKALEVVQDEYSWDRIALATQQSYQHIMYDWQAGSWGRPAKL